MKQYDQPACNTCGTPTVPESAHTLVLYFKTRADAQEMIEALKAVCPGMVGYQIGSKH